MRILRDKPLPGGESPAALRHARAAVESLWGLRAAGLLDKNRNLRH